MFKPNVLASILYKSIAGRHRPVSFLDGPITVRYRFIMFPEVPFVCHFFVPHLSVFGASERLCNVIVILVFSGICAYNCTSTYKIFSEYTHEVPQSRSTNLPRHQTKDR